MNIYQKLYIFNKFLKSKKIKSKREKYISSLKKFGVLPNPLMDIVGDFSYDDEMMNQMRLLHARSENFIIVHKV